MSIIPEPFELRALWSRRVLRMVATSFLLFAIVLTGVYGWFAWDQTVNGTVTEAVVVGREDGSAVKLTVAFVTEGGERVVTDLREFADAESHVIGDKVRITYVPRDPDLARPAGELPVDLGFFVTGGSILLFTLGVLVAYAWWFAPPSLGQRVG